MLLMLTLKPPFPLVFTIQKNYEHEQIVLMIHHIKGSGWCEWQEFETEWILQTWDSGQHRHNTSSDIFYADIFHLVHKVLNTSVHSPSNHDAETKPWKENTKISVSSHQHQKLYSHLKAISGNSSPGFWHEPVEKWLILGTKQEFFFHCTSLKGMGC